jgi:hypothetical protein
MSDELTFRLRRLYVAIGGNVETDLTKFPAKVIATEKLIGVCQDFRGGLSDEEIYNKAIHVVDDIAALRDNLIRWAVANGKDKQRVWDTFNRSFPIRVIQDLCNVEKHGYPLKQSNSGRDPKLVEVNSGMRIQPTGKGWSGVTLAPSGKLEKFGNGSASVAITGVVADKHDTVIGDLYDIEVKAVRDWEALLIEFGVRLPDGGLPT